MKKLKAKNLMISGATGSGKSNFIHGLVMELLKENSPEDLRLILINPKRVELSIYKDVPHLLTDVIFDNEKARSALRWLWNESLRRLKLMEELKASSIEKYNKLKFTKEKLAKIYVFIDEFSDLMCFDKKFFEEYFEKITTLSKLSEIYLVVSTSRPSPKDVITNKILSCFSTRIAFKTATEADSIATIGKGGAENLAENGIYLLRELSSFEIKKFESESVNEDELKIELENIKQKYAGFKEQERNEENSEDDLYPYALEIARSNGYVSASLIQRKLRTGYARAARLLDLLEENGFVEPANGVTPRKFIAKEN